VGSACLRHLLRAGHDAVAYDDLSEGHAAAVPAGRLVCGDVLDRQQLAAALRDQRSEAVMHFAAVVSVGESVAHPERHWRTNVAGTLALLEAMCEAGVPRILFSGSCSVYGSATPPPIGEAAPLAPESPYARTKRTAEWMIGDVAAAHGLGYTILRYFNAAGACDGGAHGEDHDPETHLIPLALAAAAGSREALEVFGDDYPTPDGTCLRDYVHVDDLATAHESALLATQPGSGAVYNVGTGRGHSVLEVLRACERATGRPVPRRISPRRAGDPPALIADASALRRAFGWEARHTLDAIVSSAWAWHSAHPRGYADR
jgi:UDP-glucose 4-epimerase